MQREIRLKELSELVLKECENTFNTIKSFYSGDITKEYPANVLSIGDNKASNVYMRAKINKFASIGLVLNSYNLEYKNENNLETIDKLNGLSDNLKMMFLQFPVPKQLDGNMILDYISSARYDLDGLSAGEKVRNALEFKLNTPCTAAGILLFMYIQTNMELAGKEVLIIGKSELVGLPLSEILIKLGCSVTVVSSKVKDLKQHLKNKDFIISAAGRRGLLKSSDIESQTTVIDVSINVNDNGKLCGDLEFISDNEFTYTPVPGGVGLMTTSMLVVNYLRSVLHALYMEHDYYTKEMIDELSIENLANKIINIKGRL
ncbi:MAG: tetrahydrofolate dehydrogenase/cyclohydrolase catalytic domain-containing protein [Paraclostridium sp.]